MMTAAAPLRRIAHYVPGRLTAGVSRTGSQDLERVCKGVSQLGFDSVLFSCQTSDGLPCDVTVLPSGPGTDLECLVQSCQDSGLAALIDIHPPEDPAADAVRRWQDTVLQYAACGVSGVRCLGLQHLDAEQWRHLRRSLHEQCPDFRVLAWNPGIPAERLQQYMDAGFDRCFSSLPWWDQRSPWLVQEFEHLRQVAPVIASPVVARGNQALDPRTLIDNDTLIQRLWVAAYMGQGLMMDAHRALDPELAPVVTDILRRVMDERDRQGRLMLLSGLLVPGAVLYWSGGAPFALVLHDGTDATFTQTLRILSARLPDGLVVADYAAARLARLARPKSVASLISVVRGVPVKGRHVASSNSLPRSEQRSDPARMRSQWALDQAMKADRIVIDKVTPHVDRGRFAVKLILGTCLSVQARVFMDGHAPLAVSLLWRAADQIQWQDVPMQHAGNDYWQAECLPQRLGRHYYTIQARVDDGDARHVSWQCPVFPLQVERLEAEYSSWYELFPRSMGRQGEHGSLSDVVVQLPRIRAMGFDVLYFPPIHPIGKTNRKGRNNALTTAPDDPGSPYAIGSGAGGHDAIHPQLGTLDDFRTLVREARRHDIEIALDFAIQCSPDHPWLREHPEWFQWREDGTVQYAENPPKRYEDIVNPDFYSTTAGIRQRMALWRALRDIVLFWATQGVRLFRVDNPHTKPLPFWEWMIAEVHKAHPDVVFLSEAFTRPAMMYRLAKLGFSQSYTYFTWRNTKAELTGYLSELAGAEVPNYFRPHFFVNTPDINPYFLQSSGRAGFLIRAALAATTSGLWGVYSGFELCEAQALPGKEEYQDSEKYEMRSRDWGQAGNIVSEISRLNAIRRANPALQTHRGIRFHPVSDGRVLFFSKTSPEQDSIVIAAICLSPRESVSVRLEMPPELNIAGRGPVRRLRSLWDDQVQVITTAEWHVILHPDQPFCLWSVLP